jgi:hypothetical protein
LKELNDMIVDNKLYLPELSRNRIIINDKIIIEILVTIITVLAIKPDFLIILFLYLLLLFLSLSKQNKNFI